MAKNTVVWMDIPVTDLNRAIAFYSKVLGEPVLLEKMEGWQYALLPHPKDSVSGCLAMADDDNKPSRTGPLVYLSVNGRLDEAVKAAADNGGQRRPGFAAEAPHRPLRLPRHHRRFRRQPHRPPFRNSLGSLHAPHKI